MKALQNFLAGMIIAALVCMIIFAFTSCAPSGYGCHHKFKWIIGYRPNGYGGFTGRHY